MKTERKNMDIRPRQTIFSMVLILVLTSAWLITGLQVATAQQPDSIVVIENPKRALKKIRTGKLENGFNLWQDKFKGHWAGVDIGFNMFIHTDYSGYDNEFMENDIFRSNSTFINLIQQSIGLQQTRNTIGLVTGLGLHLQSYRFDDNTTIYRDQNTDVIYPRELFFDDNQKSKLSVVSLKVPLLAEFQIPVNHYENRIYISAGFYGNYRLSSHTKIKYRIEKKEKLKVVDDYSIHNFKYGIMVRSGYRWFNIYATYDLVPFFKNNKGPGLTPFTFGVTLIRF
jgi:hypothetical protein